MRGQHLQLEERGCHSAQQVALTNLTTSHGVPIIHNTTCVCPVLPLGTDDQRHELDIPKGRRTLRKMPSYSSRHYCTWGPGFKCPRGVEKSLPTVEKRKPGPYLAIACPCQSFPSVVFAFFKRLVVGSTSI